MNLSMPDIPDLTASLGELYRQIPRGRVTTYGDLADALGDRIAARWVGQWAVNHVHHPRCPCHRIVRADGNLGRYILDDPDEKARRLRREGVEVVDGIVDLSYYRFAEFTSDRPLVPLRRLQQSLAKRVSLARPKKEPSLIGGVDVSYAANGDGVAAYVLVERSSGDVLFNLVLRRPVRFPYITTYLSFRELPVLLELLDEVDRQDRMPDVWLVDGSGLLHHRHAGIATHLGVLRRQSTIGVTKKLLCGSVDIKGIAPGEARPVLLESEPIGMALRPTAGSARPIFISPGHRVDLTLAGQIVHELIRGRRLPEPLFWADRLSRQAARK